MPAKKSIQALKAAGKKHLTKAEIEKREAEEIKAPSDGIEAPSYLSAALKKEFNKYAEQLKRVDLISNLDIDTLARFVQVQKIYLDVTKELMKEDVTSPLFSELIKHQDKLFKQARACASDLGLTMSSRVKLVIPQKEEKEESPMASFLKRRDNSD